jgi:hypothetical protein
LVEHFDTEFRNNHSIESTGKRILELIKWKYLKKIG